MANLSQISPEIYNKLVSKFENFDDFDITVEMSNEFGESTSEETEARAFSVSIESKHREPIDFEIILKDDSVINMFDIDEIESAGGKFERQWYDFVEDLKDFAVESNLIYRAQDSAVSNLQKRETREYGELAMSESKLFGTSRTSYQNIGQARLVIKHNRPINDNIPTGRAVNIDSIYIESANGERFRYPFKHLNGARAMANHVSNGGNAYDAIGGHISSLSEELSKLRQFKNYVNRSGIMAESLDTINERVLERIDSIKSEINGLQRQSYYTEFCENFQPYEQSDVPEEMVNEWVEALTIKTFNEELKSVFPYIYRLVDHVKPVLDYEDLMQEDSCPVCHCDPCECEEESHDHLEDFENHLEDAMSMSWDNDGDDSDTINKKQNPNRGSISEEVVEFVKSFFDKENGTFPRGATAIQLQASKQFGEDAGKFAKYVIDNLSSRYPVINELDDEPDMEEPMDTYESVELNRIRFLSGM